MDFENVPTKAVIVTYGKRWNLLSKTIDSVYSNSSINEIVLVQNGNLYDIRKHISQKRNIKLIVNDENLGSAGGFWCGLRELYYRNNEEFNILILDDDNILDENAFEYLKKAEKLIPNSDKHIWSLFRPNVQSLDSFNSILEKSKESILNTINGFTIMHIFNKQYKFNKRRFRKIANIITAPYSGMVLPLDVLRNVGLPNKDFYLYSDDIEFSLRISNHGYHIYQTIAAKAFDQGIAWQKLDKKNHKNRGGFFEADEVYRALYMYRNELYISYRYLKTNAFLFWVNYYSLQLWMFSIYMPKDKEGIRKFNMLRKAMKQGIKGELGRSKWIESTREENNI
jgi:GT2 family glycosyltransferase